MLSINVYTFVFINSFIINLNKTTKEMAFCLFGKKQNAISLVVLFKLIM